jgi:outer membrane autotransporter protein
MQKSDMPDLQSNTARQDDRVCSAKFLTAVFLSLILCLNPTSVLAADQTVINENDSGVGSLRQAVANVGADETIYFNIASGSSTITLSTGLTLNVDGVSLLAQPGGDVTVSLSGASDVFTLITTTSLGTIGGASALAIEATATSGPGAYGIYSMSGALSIGSIAATGSITATARTHNAYGLRGTTGVTITGGMAGDIAATAGTNEAYGVLSENGSVTIGSIASTGSITATAGTSNAYGLRGTTGVTITGEMAGSIAATAGTNDACGIYSGGAISIGSIASTGQVTATAATDSACGLFAGGNIAITGALAGTVSATVTNGANAYGLAAIGTLTLGSIASTGQVTATAATNPAYGLFAGHNIAITGGLAGTVSATVTNGANAFGLYASGTLNGGSAATPLAISGTVSATANGRAAAVYSLGAMNLSVTGTLRGVDTSGGGNGYAIQSGGGANDAVTLGTGATLVGKVDLGSGTDTLTLVGTGAASNQFINIENLVVGTGSTTSWTLNPTVANASSFTTLAINANANLTINEYVTVTGTITDNGTLTFNPGATTTYAGTVTGSGSVVKSGTATLTLSGANTYTGYTLVSGGTLDVTGTLASQAYQVDSGATLTFHQNMTLTGVTLINGTLNVPELTISAIGTLSGSGTIQGDVTSNGTISPGNSPGTLTIAGNYVQGATGVYQAEVSLKASDLLVVTGTANLGGTLLVVPQQTYYAPGTSWTILTAAGGVSGTFASVASSSWNLHFTPTYSANGVSIAIGRLSYILAGQSAKAASVGAGLDGAVYSATGEMATLLGVLDTSPPALTNYAMSVLSPEVYDAYTQAFLDGSRALTAVQRSGLAGETDAGSAAFASAQDVGPASIAALTGPNATPLGATAAPGGAAMPVGQFGVFLRPLGLHASQQGNANQSGYETLTGGLTGGILYRPSAELTLGLAPAFMTQSLTLKNAGGGQGTIQDWSLALLGAYRHDAWHVDAVARAGLNSFDSSRTLALPGLARTAKGHWNGWNTSLSVGGGYDFTAGDVTFGPIASLEWQHVSQDAFSETRAGTVGQRLQGRNNDAVKSVVGARVFRSFETTHGTITPELRAAWGAQWLGESQGITASFIGAPLSEYRAQTADHAYHAAILDAGVTMRMGKALSASARAGVELFRPGHESQAVSLGLLYAF